MHEDHKREQYFFDAPTVTKLAAFVRQFERPALLCCPMVGKALHEQGTRVPILDVDERFAYLPSFVRFDVYQPVPPRGWVEPDFILIDPPFFKVRPDQLFNAVRHLTRGDLGVGLLIASNPARAPAFLGTFTLFGLQPSGYRPSYVSVDDDVGIEFLSANIPQDKLTLLGTT
jgi:hypothetical protein